jgi:hypothetical protein
VQHRLFVEQVAQFRRKLETGAKDALAGVTFLKDWPEPPARNFSDEDISGTTSRPGNPDAL